MFVMCSGNFVRYPLIATGLMRIYGLNPMECIIFTALREVQIPRILMPGGSRYLEIGSQPKV